METPIYKLRMDRTSVRGLALGLKSVICRNAPRRYRHGYRKDRRRASEEERAKKAELSGKSAIRHPQEATNAFDVDSSGDHEQRTQ
jgi:hypothetical protein